MDNGGGEKCPFDFNFDPATFKVGDYVSYRVPGLFQDFPFMGVITGVHEDHIELIADPAQPNDVMRGTRESRPVVADDQVR